ncbi:MAG: hypothetical protein FD123_3210 [Bacteroidetes bacterium]|nr:MAG: hypothetical protein FD123_3210 [Bacteroidota bacterium]
MLYAILKVLMRITIRVFFRKVHIRNLDQVPRTGPLLVCANHPSAFMDPIMVAALLGRPVHFLAKAAIFKTKFAQWMLPKLNIIPIYRKQDDPAQMHKNQETFEKCFEHLGKGGAILIFPEGISITERKLRELKTGAARIALGAAKKYDYKLDVHIVTVGLNYNNPHRFRDEVFINAEKALSVSAFFEQHKTDEFAAAQELTDEIRKRLETHIISIEDAHNDELVARIEKLYKQRLMRERGISKEETEKSFELTRRIAETVRYFSEKDPERVARISKDIDRYLRDVDRTGLSDRQLDTSRRRGSRVVKNGAELAFIIFGFPFFLFGTICNGIPYWLVKGFVSAKVKQREFQGSIAMAGGMFLYLTWYTLIAVFSWKYIFHHWLALVFTANLIPAGIWAFYYYTVLKHIRRRWFFASLFHKRTALVADFIVQRENLIKEFEIAAEEFRKTE